MSKILLGCIADDFTGASDLANNLVRAGMRVVQTIGVPTGPLGADVDAVVVALKSRTIAPAEAVAQSLAALQWLQAQGAQQIYFKYCSTFDSTFSGETRGNIGPVTEALMDALKTDFTIATPAFPDNQRTVFKGYLFAGDVLLNESGMQNHPLTPMTDANLVRVLQAQTRRKVGLIDYRVVARGEAAIRARIDRLKAEGVGVAVVDALSNDDLLRLGPALKAMPLVTAGSGVAIGLPQNFGITPSSRASELPPAGGLQAVVSGSCSLATNRQVLAFIKSGRPALGIDPLRIAAGVDVAAEALAWAAPLIPYHRPGDPQAAQQVAQTIARYGERGTPIRAVMLERLGPNVWHDSPAAAMATLEELEETARLMALSHPQPQPLTEIQIDELRQTFGEIGRAHV